LIQCARWQKKAAAQHWFYAHLQRNGWMDLSLSHCHSGAECNAQNNLHRESREAKGRLANGKGLTPTAASSDTDRPFKNMKSNID
jgi:hypothetical protein